MGSDEPDTSDDDLQTLTPSLKSAVAGGSVMIAGGLQTLLGVQTLDMLRMQGLALAAAVVLLGLGLPNVLLGWNIRRVRGWAARGALFVTAGAGLVDLCWAVFLVLNGFFSPLAFLLVPVNVGAAALAYVRVGPGKRADEARLRLGSQGLDAGI